MRVLVTGASGLLGGRLVERLAGRFTPIVARHASDAPPGFESVALDIRSEAGLAEALERARADAVLHAAACADADLCEREPERARLLNTLASARLAGLCLERGCRLVALSTDLVLAGDRSASDEQARAAPLLEYGKSKLAAERAVLEASPEFAVLRVALVVGRGFGPRATASEGLLRTLAAGGRPRLFSDQFRTPIDPESVADAVALVLDGRGSGLFHVGGGERVSRYQLGQRVARAFGLDESLLDAIEQTQEPIGVPRPSDCSLDSGRARRELGFEARPLDVALRESRLA